MDPSAQDGNGAQETLPPPPPVPQNVTPMRVGSEHGVKKVVRVPMARRGFGTKGNRVPILTNHFKVNVSKVDGYFFHYSVALSFEDGPVDGKGIGRKVLDRVRETYAAELEGKNFAYDGEKSLFTVGPLPQKKLEFTVVLEDVTSNRNTGKDCSEGHDGLNDSDRKRFRRPYRSKTYKVDVSFAAKIPMQAIANALRGQESENAQEAIRVLDIILRQHAAKQGCLLVRQSFFHSDPRNFIQVGGGVDACRGFHTSFRTTESGLSLNIGIELCELVSLQRYTKSLSTLQRASLVEKSRQKPDERKSALTNALKINNYGADEMLKSSGVSISPSFMQVEGRVLPTPRLKVGNGEDLFARNGKWNFNNKRLIEACTIERWAVVNFSARCDVRALIKDLMKVAGMKGVKIEEPFDVIEENQHDRRASAPARVEKMIVQIKSRLPGPPKFLLCLLPERKNCDIYGPWKRKNLSDLGVVTQCLAPARVNDQYLTNLLLKINAKLGGLNSALASEVSPSIPMVSKVPTLILGMDVSHGSPGQSDTPSIAAVVSSRNWPSISRYRACVRTQSPRVEMIDSLFKQVSDKEDDGIIRELLIDFYTSSGKRKPDQIIIFRDGVSESQFNQVLNIELNQIIEACKFLDENWSPKFVVIIAQKNHHTKFFQANSSDNVQPGTIIDNNVCHPRGNDFYLCAHAGMIGTTRPTHYHVLHDEVGFSADDLQELVHSLSYVYQRSTTAISVVAPICYAHLAASQLGQWIKFEEKSETNSSSGPNHNILPMPKLNDNLSYTLMEETTGPDFQHKSNGGLRNSHKSMNMTTMHGPSHHHTANYSYYRPPTFLPHRRFHDQPIPGFENNFPSNHFPRPSSPTMRSGGYQAQAFASPDSPFTGLIPHDIGGNSSTMVQGGHANNNVRGPALSDHNTRLNIFTPSGSGYGPPIPGTPGAVDTFPQRGFYRGPYPQYSFPETNPLPIPVLRANIVNQIEYYFSDENLQSDYFLISLMDDQGWVPISNIAEFRRVKTMNVEIPFILDALQTSTTIEVQGEKIRRRDVWSQWIPASVNSKPSSPVSNADTNE